MGIIVAVIVIIILIIALFFTLGSFFAGILGVLAVLALIWVTSLFIMSNADGSISAIVGVLAIVATILFFSTGACDHVFAACFNIPSGCIDSVDHYPARMIICDGKIVYRSNGKCPEKK